MLTQEDFGASSMSVDGRLQRSSWKADAIRRGDLKISGPIPIAEETARQEERDAETGPLVSRPQLPDGTSTQAPQPPTDPNNKSMEPESVASHASDTTNNEVHRLRHKVSSPSLRAVSESQPAPFPPATLQSHSTAISLMRRGSAVTDARKKRKGSLRNVFRRVFGRKAKDDEDVQSPRHGHHRSEPLAILESPMVAPAKEDIIHISDVPVRELEPINPLAQHLPFPMNVNAPQEASPPHDYLTFNFQSSELNRRRATLPSVLQLAAAEKPLAEPHDAESPQIGIALSSPPPLPHSSIQSKRRSRSMGAIRDLAQERPSIERRRSAEIRFWRGSYQSGIVYSTASPRLHTSHTVQTVQAVDNYGADRDSTELENLATTSTPASTHSNAEDPEGLQQAAALHLGHPENVSPRLEVESLQSDDLVVSKQSEKPLSLEERVQHLEDNVQALETSVRRISGRTNRQTIILENAPKGQRPQNASSSPNSGFLESDHAISSSDPNVGLVQGDADLPNSSYLDDCAHSQQTIIGLDLDKILPPSYNGNSDLARQLAVFTEALQHEHMARLDRLQREVSDLRAVFEMLVSSRPSYRTPSPDAIIMSNEEPLSTPRAQSHSLRGFGHDSEDDAPNTVRKIRETIISRFSQSDSEADNYSMTSNVTSPEAWATPKEEGGFGSGFFSTNRSKEVF